MATWYELSSVSAFAAFKTSSGWLRPKHKVLEPWRLAKPRAEEQGWPWPESAGTALAL